MEEEEEEDEEEEEKEKEEEEWSPAWKINGVVRQGGRCAVAANTAGGDGAGAAGGDSTGAQNIIRWTPLTPSWPLHFFQITVFLVDFFSEGLGSIS